MIRMSKSKTVVLLILSLILVYLHLYDGNKVNREKELVNQRVDESQKSVDNDSRLEKILNSKLPPDGNAAKTEEIRVEISHRNEIQEINNLEKFGPLNPSTNIIMIQVHNRLEALKFVIEGLSKVHYIEDSLLIFSHDIFDPEMCKVIGEIDFARVTQIFYPYSVQLHPNSFPGPDNDDPSKKNMDAVQPNKRDANIVQAKHHWWWKASFVFEKMPLLQNHDGIIIFIEEDHYVSPDFLWVANLMETEMKENRCLGCHLLALGEVMRAWNIDVGSSATQGFVASWKQHGTGMAFNRTTWGHMRQCAPTFCTHDDYNWDWSLTRVSYACFQMVVFVPVAPRIFHFGTCGMHHKQKKCDFETPVKKIQENIKNHYKILFPGKLVVLNRLGNPFAVTTGYGGWSDKRDQELCMKIVSQ